MCYCSRTQNNIIKLLNMKAHKIDPLIKLDDALEIHNGKQASLARELGLARSVVCEWKAKGLEFLKPLHAHRMKKMHPKLKDHKKNSKGEK